MSQQRAPATAEHLEAAARLLAENGPSGGGRKHTLAQVERVAGLSRSTLARLWPSARDLADDVTAHAAFGRPDWHRHLVASEPAAPCEESLAGALRRSATVTGALHRTAIRTAPDSPLADGLAAFEREATEHLARWLAVHLRAHGMRRTPALTHRDIAVLLVAHVEGWLVHHAVRRAPSVALDDERVRVCARCVARQVREASVAGVDEGPDAAPVPWPEEEADRRTRILEAVVAEEERTEAGRPGGPVPTRLVEPGPLAGALGVTERRAQMIWPTAAAENADIVAHLFRRVAARSEEVHQRTLARLVGEDVGAVAPTEDDPEAPLAAILMPLLSDAIEVATEDRASYLACSLALADAEVAEAARAGLRTWQAQQGVRVLATLQLVRYRMDPSVDLGQYGDLAFAVCLGSSLLGLSHPELLVRRSRFAGALLSLLGVGAIGALRGMTDAYDTLGPTRWWRDHPEVEP